MSIKLRRHSINFKREKTKYFRLISEAHGNTFTITCGSSVTTSYLKYLEYSTDEGKTWTKVNNSSSTVTISIPNIDIGEGVLLRGNGTSTATTATNNNALYRTTISATGNFKVAGCLMSILKGKNVDENTSIGTSTYTFHRLFHYSSKLTDASNLIFPPDVTSYCYRCMFIGCTSLIYGPTLPVLTLLTGCYYLMFNGCTAIKHITMLATDISASNCLYQWFPSTVAELEFHRNPAATWWVTGTSGIPSESTLFDGTEETAEDYTFIDSEVHRIVLLRWGGRMGGNAAAARWKNSIRIGGVDGKVLKRQLANIILVHSEFRTNTLITDLSDFDLFCNLEYIGSTNITAYYSLSTSSGFYDCTSLTKITLPNTVKSLGAAYSYSKGCFMHTAIESIYIPDSVIAASDSLFSGCTNLKSVRWGSNLPSRANTTSYYGGTFSSCSNLETITNFPEDPSTLGSNYFYNCSKLDFRTGFLNFAGIKDIGTEAFRGCPLLPTSVIFSSVTTTGNYAFRNSSTRYFYFPKLTDFSGYKFAYAKADLVDLGELITSLSTSGASSMWSTNFIGTLVLRTKTSLTLSGYFSSRVAKYYVYEDIYDTVVSNYSSLASKIFKIGGQEWEEEFESAYEYADYPLSDPVTYTELDGGNLDIPFILYNPVVTLNLKFIRDDYRSIVLPFAEVGWEYTRMGGTEFREITGVTATVDGSGDLTGFTVLTQAVNGNIVPNKPYILTTGMNGGGISGDYYTEKIYAEGVVYPTVPTTDEFTSNGYKFSFTGTYNEIDNMEGKYAFNGTNWVLCTSSDTMKATYVYLEVTKIEE